MRDYKIGRKVKISLWVVILALAVSTWLAYSSIDGARPNSQAKQSDSAEYAAKVEAAYDAQEKSSQTKNMQVEKQRLKSEQARIKEVRTLLATTVVRYYAGNELAGDQRLKDKTFKVFGEIRRVGKDIASRPYIVIRGPEDELREVQCYFDASHIDQLASFKPGQEVTVYGICRGLAINVIMDDCEVAQQ